MTFYLVNAKPKPNVLKLKNEIDSGRIDELEPLENLISKFARRKNG